MNLDVLKSCLRQWMQIATWHTGHPNDEGRFHMALKKAFDELGLHISGSDFEEAIGQLADELCPNWSEERRAEVVRQFTIKAECITNYLLDTRNA